MQEVEPVRDHEFSSPFTFASSVKTRTVRLIRHAGDGIVSQRQACTSLLKRYPAASRCVEDPARRRRERGTWIGPGSWRGGSCTGGIPQHETELPLRGGDEGIEG